MTKHTMTEMRKLRDRRNKLLEKQEMTKALKVEKKMRRLSVKEGVSGSLSKSGLRFN